MTDGFDWHLAIEINIRGLTAVGLWPNSETYKLNFYGLYTAVSVFLFIYCHIFFQIINIYFIFDDLNAVTGIVFVGLTEIMSILKSYAMIHHVKVLKELMRKLDDDDFQPKNEVQRMMVDRRVHLWQRIYKIFFASAAGTIVMWTVFPIFDGSIKDSRLPFSAWYPYNYKASPYYEITYIYQIVAMSFVACTNLNLDTFIAVLMVIVSAQCDCLIDNLKNLHESENVRKKFCDCIQHHQKILEFAKISNNFFNLVVFNQFFTSAVSLALTMFQLTVVAPLSSEFYSLIIYGNAIFVQIFIYCWFGNEVTFKSRQIPLSAYEFTWIDESLNTKKDLVFFIAETQKPIMMSAFNLFYLSLDTFVKILKTSWSYFAVLNNINSTK